MEEIQVGEYIKNNKGNIGKVIGIFKGHCTAKYHIEFQGTVKVKRQYLSTKTILKHSKNIIDLIEVGDIIEWEYEGFGHYGINEVINRFGTIGVYGIEYDDVIPLKNINIKRILTHEQYENNCYRIGE